VVSQSVCPGIKHPCGTCDQILLPVGKLLSEICGLVSVGRPLWREDASAICSVITQWSEYLRTRNHTLMSHLRLPQPGWPVPRIYSPQEQSDPVIPPGIGFALHRAKFPYLFPAKEQEPLLKIEGRRSKLLYVWRSNSMSWYRAPLWDMRPGITSCLKFAVLFLWGALFDEKRRLLYDWRSVSQYVLVSSTLVEFASRYYFLSEFFCQKFVASFLWDALTDERTSVQFAVQFPNGIINPTQHKPATTDNIPHTFNLHTFCV
jgi:hypothetical protein